MKPCCSQGELRPLGRQIGCDLGFRLMQSRIPGPDDQLLCLCAAKTDAEGVCTCDVSAGELTWSRKTSVRKSLHLTKRRSLSKTNLLLSCKEVTSFSTTQIDEPVVDR